MAVLTRQLALVSESQQIPDGDVLKVSAALQKQATRDLSPIWDISATVDTFKTLEDVPQGYWPMLVMDDIGTPGANGVHEDKNGQPFALITASPDLDTWALTASHEALEMLVDPQGNRLVAGDSPMAGQGRVSFLVEVADPSEAADFAYTVNGILVADFYTPNFFDPVASSTMRYSFTGAIKEPRQVLPGGYLSWLDAGSGHWWQEFWFDGGDKASFRDLGVIDQKANGNVRAAIDRLTMEGTMKAIARGRKKADAAGLSSAIAAKSSASTAAAWRQQIGDIVATAKKRPANAPGSRRTRPRVKPAE